MKNKLLLLILSICGFLPFQANAAKLYFGTDESVSYIADTKLAGSDKRKVYLGHLIQTNFFIAPYNFESKGYVLCKVGEPQECKHLPPEDLLKGFQENGFIPNPLPPLKFTWWDYVFGYSLWIFLVVIFGAAFISIRLERKKNAT
ncbi:MAG: hypothetical protein LBE62_07015 [Azonexus sp.]|jgi:hypothetical protein|nr:hypothetical protein [Azonexus sp.]